MPHIAQSQHDNHFAPDLKLARVYAQEQELEGISLSGTSDSH
jgi:hypothetical protein